MTAAYERVTSLAELFARVGELALATLVFDIEPLVAPWNGGQPELDRGVAEILGRDLLLADVPLHHVVVEVGDEVYEVVPRRFGLPLRCAGGVDRGGWLQ